MHDRKAEFSLLTMELSRELTTTVTPNPARYQQGRLSMSANTLQAGFYTSFTRWVIAEPALD